MNRKGAEFVYSVLIRFHLTRKLVFFGLVYYLSRVAGLDFTLGIRPFVGFLAFFLAYSSIYFVNDLLDSDFDKKRKNNTYPKPLAMEIATPRDYINLSYLHSILGLSACFLFSQVLGVLTLLNLLVAHIRHFVKPIIPRTALIMLLEFLNLQAITAAFDPANILNPTLLVIYGIVSVFYAFLYFGYRHEKISEKAIFSGFALAAVLILAYSWIKAFEFARIAFLIFLIFVYSVVWFISVRFLRKDWLMDIVQFLGALVLMAAGSL